MPQSVLIKAALSAPGARAILNPHLPLLFLNSGACRRHTGRDAFKRRPEALLSSSTFVAGMLGQGYGNHFVSLTRSPESVRVCVCVCVSISLDNNIQPPCLLLLFALKLRVQHLVHKEKSQIDLRIPWVLIITQRSTQGRKGWEKSLKERQTEKANSIS